MRYVPLLQLNAPGGGVVPYTLVALISGWVLQKLQGVVTATSRAAKWHAPATVGTPGLSGVTSPPALVSQVRPELALEKSGDARRLGSMVTVTIPSVVAELLHSGVQARPSRERLYHASLTTLV